LLIKPNLLPYPTDPCTPPSPHRRTPARLAKPPCPFQDTAANPLARPTTTQPLHSPPPPSPCSLAPPPKIAAGELHRVVALGVPDSGRHALTPRRRGCRLDLAVVSSSTVVRGACKASPPLEKSGVTPEPRRHRSRHGLDPTAPAALARPAPVHATGGQLHPCHWEEKEVRRHARRMSR
jgi:hypothetical protein